MSGGSNPAALVQRFKFLPTNNRFAYQSRLGRLTQHSVKLISYEELIDNWDTLLADIQEFLGVEKATVKQSIPKSETRKC